MSDFSVEGPEQFSEATRASLAQTMTRLVEGLHQHTNSLTELPGGTRSLPAVFAAHEAVEVLVHAWADAVSDHTGTSLALIPPDEDEDGDDCGTEDTELSDGDVVSVVERWDLAVTDVSALVEAGRQAHVRWSQETYEDAVVAVNSPALALYAITHETSAPWVDLPGIDVRNGTRLYVRPDAALERADTADDQVLQPDGEVLLNEHWV
jgi:hypothetical protein